MSKIAARIVFLVWGVMAFREEACLVPWQIWRLENLTDKLTSRKFAKLWNREKMKQISFERYIWMIAKTEIANDSKIRLRFENLTGKKTIRKFVIVDKFCNRYFLIFDTNANFQGVILFWCRWQILWSLFSNKMQP